MLKELGIELREPRYLFSFPNRYPFENVLYHDGRIQAILDFEWARRGPRDIDLDVLLRFVFFPKPFTSWKPPRNAKMIAVNVAEQHRVDRAEALVVRARDLAVVGPGVDEVARLLLPQLTFDHAAVDLLEAGRAGVVPDRLGRFAVR